MSVVPGSPSLGALERLASRASGVVPPDLVLPRIPSPFEALPLAATPSEESAQVEVNPTARRPREAASDDGTSRREWPAAAARWEPEGQALPVVVRTTSPIVPVAAPPIGRAPLEPVQPSTRADPTAAMRIEPHTAAAPVRATEARLESKPERPTGSTNPELRAHPPRQAPREQRATPGQTMAQRTTVVHRHVSAIEPRRHDTGARSAVAIDPPAVHVTIGRVEIRASSMSAPAQAKQDGGHAGRGETSLTVYLRRRGLGSRS